MGKILETSLFDWFCFVSFLSANCSIHCTGCIYMFIYDPFIFVLLLSVFGMLYFNVIITLLCCFQLYFRLFVFDAGNVIAI